MPKDPKLKRDGRHEKVVLQKKVDRVGISGPYTKRELRKLLLSSISLLQSDDKDSTELESTLRKGTGLSQLDLDKIKEGKLDEISEEAKRALKDLEVTKDSIKSATKGGKNGEKDGEEKDSEKVKKREKTFEDLLREKGLSASLIKSLMENGLTDEYIRLLKALGFTDEEIERLRRAYESGIHDSTSTSDSEVSCASSTLSFDEQLSPESLYLKNFLSKALPRALRDMASKKPYDPIEYLGHWLLNFKICEEREKRRKEFEMELMLEREKYKMMKLEDQESELVEVGGEEYIEDWNFINYINT